MSAAFAVPVSGYALTGSWLFSALHVAPLCFAPGWPANAAHWAGSDDSDRLKPCGQDLFLTNKT